MNFLAASLLSLSTNYLSSARALRMKEFLNFLRRPQIMLSVDDPMNIRHFGRYTVELDTLRSRRDGRIDTDQVSGLFRERLSAPLRL